MDEHVLVVRTELFHKIGCFQGFSEDASTYLETLLDPKNTQFLPRSLMEDDPSYKQLIPYVLFRYQDDDGDRFFQYTRGSGQGEKRLHAKKSVGVGGHVSAEDNHCDDAYIAGMQRELEEEINFTPAEGQDPNGQIIGMINDDSNDVGKVHLGVVHLIDVATPTITPKEKDLCDSSFWTKEKLNCEKEGFETWSQIVIAQLDKLPTVQKI